VIRIAGYQTIDLWREALGSRTYRGRRERDNAQVRIKALRTDYTRIADNARFNHEYEIIQRIDSEAVAKVLEVVQHADGFVVVLEAAGPADLADLLAERGQLNSAEFLDRAVEMAEAVAEVHRHKLIHRDVKPRSFGQGPGGRLKLTGFGADTLVTRANEEIFHPSVLAETLPYTSPEQTGRMNRAVDHRTDLYSLGVIFYQLLTGRRPFEAADPMELIHAHIALVPAAPAALDPRVPAALSAITMKLLEKNAENRYQSASGLRADLEECRRRLKERGRIGDFAIGRLDMPDLFQLHQKLYGREGDIQQLNHAFEAVLAGERKIVLVSGYSGVGKSTLVQEILRPLAREHGYYISGKFDQYNRDTPYSALIQAFDTLVRQLLSESEERLARWRTAILSALGNNGQVMCEVIPSLAHILGEQPPVPVVGPVEAQNRFNLYFQKFVSVFARHAHPLALFLDDLQWIDSASLGLLRTLLADDTMEALFFTGAYRDNEVSPAHPFIMALGELEKSGLQVENIVLAPLTRGHLLELLRDNLKQDSCGPLAELVLKKTGGNPFFVKQFIRSLHDEGALSFDERIGWRWDLARIDALQYTANVIDLMVGTIQRLSPATQETLKLAAAIGNRFDLRVLSTVSEASPEEVYGKLDRALEDGLIVSADDQYRFAHDKIQEAAYSMIPSEERAAFHLRIGRLLHKELDRDDRQGLFDLVNHLNSAGDLIQDPGERIEVARLNLRTAERAGESAAFSAALNYVHLGLARLPGDPFSADYPLSLSLFMKKGVMESLCDRHDEALGTLSRCYEHARGRLDQTEVRRLKMNVQVLKNDLPAALEEGLVAIRSFGIDLPPFPDDRAVADELAATMHLIGERPIEFLIDLPLLADPEIKVLQDVLQELFVPCYFLGTNNVGITVMKILQNSIRHGISASSIQACVRFGMFLCAVGDIERGYAFGRAAVRLNERYPDKKSEAMFCNMWGAFVQHWKERYQAYKESHIKGVQVALETGQYIWAFYNAVNSSTNSLLAGRYLSELCAESRSYLLQLQKLDRFNAVTWIVGAVGQLGHNLMHRTEEPHALKGEWLDIDTAIEEARRINNQAMLFFANFYRLILGLFQGVYEATADLAYQTDPSIPGVASWQGNPCFHFYAGVCFTQASDSVGPEPRERYLSRARQYAGRLARWAELCPENLRHRWQLLSAELLRLDGEAAAAGERYDEGIAAARQGRFVQDEALGNELCARHYLRLGRETIARAYLTEAHKLYARWGATQVMRRLEREHAELLEHAAPYPRAELAPKVAGAPGARAPEGLLPGAELDVGSVLKALQAISGEIVLSRLLERLLRIILQNAGATRGILILKRESKLVIEAEGLSDEEPVAVLRSIPLDARDDLSVHVVHYVARMEESVVVGDATDDERFANDPYLARRAPKSILALPIVRQGHVAGVIYLENDLTTFAFTRERVDVLQLLSSQVAISVENALLYSKLEETVEARTAELRAANEEIMLLHAAQKRQQEEEIAEKLDVIARQRDVIHALSTPIIEVWDGVLTLPVIGALDDARAAQVLEDLLRQIVQSRSSHAILDLTGVSDVDAGTAERIVRIVRAIQLLGAQGIITGIHPAIAQTMTTVGVDLRGLVTRASLREGLQTCIEEIRGRRR
jgi:predicted ATPase/GAF domain-containing protein/anti-anti-sigma regulatory factor